MINLSLTQIFLLIFLIFALSRVFLRFKDGDLLFPGFFFWSFLFGSATIIVLIPGITGELANFIGIGRGVDAVIYVSIVTLFYLVFRLYVYLQDIKYEITELVKKIALKEIERENEKKSTKN